MQRPSPASAWGWPWKPVPRNADCAVLAGARPLADGLPPLLAASSAVYEGLGTRKRRAGRQRRFSACCSGRGGSGRYLQDAGRAAAGRLRRTAPAWQNAKRDFRRLPYPWGVCLRGRAKGGKRHCQAMRPNDRRVRTASPTRVCPVRRTPLHRRFTLRLRRDKTRRRSVPCPFGLWPAGKCA